MRDIAQVIAAYNEQRGALMAMRGRAYGAQNLIMAVLALALVAAAFRVAKGGSIGSAVAVVLIGVIALGIGFTILRRLAERPGIALRNTMREQVFPALFHDIGDLTFKPDSKGFYDEIPDDIKPSGDRVSGDDLIEGNYRGCRIAISEVTVSHTIERGDRKETVLAFKGICIRTELEHPMPSLIVRKARLAVARWISQKIGACGDTPHVAFEDEAFDAVFDVHSSDEKFARAVFSTQGRTTLTMLRNSHATGALQFAALDTLAYVLIESEKGLFELPPLERPFDAPSDGLALQNEMRGFLDVIDGVRGLLVGGLSPRP